MFQLYLAQLRWLHNQFVQNQTLDDLQIFCFWANSELAACTTSFALFYSLDKKWKGNLHLIDKFDLCNN